MMSESYPSVNEPDALRPVPVNYSPSPDFPPSNSLLTLDPALLKPNSALEESEGSGALRDSALGRRGRERETRRREILLTARRLFAINGYTGTTLDEVARHTELSKPTLYQYFRNKDHLYFAILDEGLGDMCAILEKESLAERSFSDNLRAIVLLLLIYFRKNADFFLMLRQYRDRPRVEGAGELQAGARENWELFHERLAGLLGRGVRRGEFARHDLSQMASVLFEAIGVYTLAFQRPDELRSAREMADELMNLFLYGILQR
jgi:AcrR family transcriptional regulator